MNNQEELERIKSIRERQIDARDPGNKERQTQQRIAKKYKRIRSKENFFTDGWKGLSKAWKGFIYGAFLGLIIKLILPSFLPGPGGSLLGFAAILFCMAIGMTIGGTFDWRDNLKDKIN